MPQTKVMEAAIFFAKAKGVLPAPESAHGIAAAIDQAIEASDNGETRTISLNLSGHGYFDTGSYKKYLNGELEDYDYPAESSEEALPIYQ